MSLLEKKYEAHKRGFQKALDTGSSETHRPASVQEEGERVRDRWETGAR